RVVQPRASIAETLEHHEVIEVPEEDRGQRQLGELARLLLEAASDHAVRARGAQQPAALAAAAPHAAVDPHLLHRNMAAAQAASASGGRARRRDVHYRAGLR